jgi:AbrB family looped-hinge helix DNA binding protein
MKATLSSKGQLVLPAEVRRQLRLSRGQRLEIEVRDGAVVLRPASKVRRYKAGRHSVSGLPVMVAVDRPSRKVSAAEIAGLNAELL